jgi:hypothetical protein
LLLRMSHPSDTHSLLQQAMRAPGDTFNVDALVTAVRS